jgi:hypothetical protein
VNERVVDVDEACAVCETVIWQGSRGYATGSDPGGAVVCVSCYRSHVHPSPMLPLPPDPEEPRVGRAAA